MPLETSIGNTPPVWDVDVAFPARYTQTGFTLLTDCVWINGPGFLTGTIGTNLGRTISSFTQGGAGVNEYMGYYSGVYAMGIYTTGAIPMHGFGNVPIVPTLNASVTGPVFAGLSPGWNRSQWVRFSLALYPGCVLTTASGVALQQNAGPVAASRWAGAGAQPNAGAFGIYGDGAGGLQFISYDATTPGPAGVLLAVPIPAPALPNQFQTFDFFITGAGPNRTATVDVYVNGALLPGASGLQFTNAVGGIYFDTSGAGAGPPAYTLLIRNGDPVGTGLNRMVFGEWRIRCGRYTYDGAELLS